MAPGTPTTPAVGQPPPPELWDWYKYHADQRLRSFNFFVVFVGGLFVLLGSADVNNHHLIARVAAALGVLLSIGFFMLDVRNAQLVDIAGDAIKNPGTTLADVIRSADQKTITWGDINLVRGSRPLLTSVARHRFVLRAIMLAAAIAFLVIACTGP
jgi:hypothetical protein